nr:sarcosine oxidase subunit gamma [Mangrovicoccus sp. HB161399]
MIPMTALGAAEPRELRIGGLSLREDDGLALASLALPQGAPPVAPFGLALPGPGGLVRGPEGLGAFWTGPGQWMLEGTDRAGTGFAAQLAAEAPGARITDQTDSWAVIEIAGPGLGALLERLANLPPASVAPGCAARTGLHHMSVFLLRRSETELAVLGMRSQAGSLWHVLETALARLAA